MNAAPWFVGDETTAAGYRLAGFEVRICEPGAAAGVLRDVLANRPISLILIAAPHARHIGAETLHALSAACDPPVAVVRDAAGSESPPDLLRLVRSMLGVG